MSPTPEPWERSVYKNGGSRIFKGRTLIADTYQEEDADLFFAAPGLLAALKDIIEFPPPDLHDEECRVVGEDVRCIEDCRVANARDAVARATSNGGSTPIPRSSTT